MLLASLIVTAHYSFFSTLKHILIHSLTLRFFSGEITLMLIDRVAFTC